MISYLYFCYSSFKSRRFAVSYRGACSKPFRLLVSAIVLGKKIVSEVPFIFIFLCFINKKVRVCGSKI